MACFQPIIRKDLPGHPMIPCGKCPPCSRRKINAWAFRIKQEEKVCTSADFLTLTYATKNLPFSGNGYPTLTKRDLQLFFKRLRKTHSTQIRYYAVGEYGTIGERPHYHVILFNARRDLIQPAWELGQIHYGTATGASVAYTLKYISKISKVPCGPHDDRQKEFSLMSKGLGASYLTAEMIAYHKADLHNRVCHTVEDGKKVAMPRYYKEKIYTKHERQRIAAGAQKRAREEFQKETALLEPIIDNDGVIVSYLSTPAYTKKQWELHQAKVADSKNWLKQSTKGEKL